MKKWGLVVTLLYALILVGLLTPAFLFLAASSTPSLSDFKLIYGHWAFWIIAGVFILGQFVLLSLSVDTSQRRMRPRTPIVASAITAGLFLMIITVVIVLASLLVVLGESKVPDLGTAMRLVGLFVIPWLVWGVLFYRFYRDSTDPVTRALSWLLRGSVLELLVAVPAHVVVRRRHDCCAPGVTAFGITSGIAIMLLSFGPSVLLLYKKRMEKYGMRELVPK
jgi:hypothetical protein